MGAALGPLPGLLKGQLFRMCRVCLCPKLSPSHLTPTTSPPAPYHPGHPRRTVSQQHVVQGAQLPIGCSSPSSPRLAGAQPQVPPSAPCGGTACHGFRRGGKVHCAAARGGGRRERGEAEGSLWNVSVGPTRGRAARRGLATSVGRRLLIGGARARAPPLRPAAAGEARAGVCGGPSGARAGWRRRRR